MSGMSRLLRKGRDRRSRSDLLKVARDHQVSFSQSSKDFHTVSACHSQFYEPHLGLSVFPDDIDIFSRLTGPDCDLRDPCPPRTGTGVCSIVDVSASLNMAANQRMRPGPRSWDSADPWAGRRTHIPCSGPGGHRSGQPIARFQRSLASGRRLGWAARTCRFWPDRGPFAQESQASASRND